MQPDNSDWVIDCNFSLKFKSEEDANIFYTSYLPEYQSIPRKRTQTSIKLTSNKVIFSILAKDLTAFRATLNSIMQFGNVVFKIIEKVDSLK